MRILCLHDPIIKIITSERDLTTEGDSKPVRGGSELLA